MTHELAVGGADADQLLARLPRDVLDSLTPEQTTAIRKAVDERIWKDDHYTNIRLTIPFPWRPIYLAVVAGGERRNRIRRQSLRLQHPLRTFGNLVFAAAGAASVLVTAAVGVLVLSSILEF
jgi:hypothetical protein